VPVFDWRPPHVRPNDIAGFRQAVEASPNFFTTSDAQTTAIIVGWSTYGTMTNGFVQTDRHSRGGAGRRWWWPRETWQASRDRPSADKLAQTGMQLERLRFKAP
jgi:hypothetical protein